MASCASHLAQRSATHCSSGLRSRPKFTPFSPACMLLGGSGSAAMTACSPAANSISMSMTRLCSRAGTARGARLVAKAVEGKEGFGYSRKDIILIGAGLIGLGYAMYYGLQAAGLEAGIAGNWVQLIIFLGICVGWISSYLFRVATKQMTYVKQLEAYEDAVIRKRLEEMTEEELGDLMRESEAERNKRGGRP